MAKEQNTYNESSVVRPTSARDDLKAKIKALKAKGSSARSVWDPLGEDKALIIKNIEDVAEYFHRSAMAEMEKRGEHIEEAGNRIHKTRSATFVNDEVPFMLDAERAVAKVRSETDASKITPLAEKLREGGVGIYENQVRTIVATMVEMTLNVNAKGRGKGMKSGVVLGPMQSGKTGTALGFATFVAPILYMLTGVRLYPLFLTTNQHSHREQTKTEYESVLALYGDVEIIVGEKSTSLRDYFTAPDFMELMYADAGYEKDSKPDDKFVSYPSPNNYHGVVLKDAAKVMGSTYDIQDLIQARVHGKALRQLRERMNKATALGFSLLLLLDEPQYGAAGDDPVSVTDDNGREKVRGCVIKQILQDIEHEVLAADGKHAAVAFSATPFEMAFDEFFLVRSYLSEEYVGFNMWGGEPIDEGVETQQPAVYRWSDPAFVELDPEMPNIAKHFACTEASRRWLEGQGLSPLTARRRAGRMFRKLVSHLLLGRPDAGLCVRFINNNAETSQLIKDFKLDDDFEVIRFDGNNHMSIRQQIERAREHSSKRLLIAVTNKARMGDNFPKDIELFMDFTGGPSTLNTLLQSMVGRACGIGKYHSKVVLSDRAVDIFDAYVESMGQVVTTPSRGSIRVSDGVEIDTRGRGSRLMRIGLYGPGAQDCIIQAFIEDINERIISQRYPKLTATADRKQGTAVELLDIMEEHDIFNYVMRADVQRRLFPMYRDMDVVLPTETVVDDKKRLSWPLRENNTVAVTFRHNTEALAALRSHGTTTFLGADRAPYTTRETRRPENAHKRTGELYVQINLMKVDAKGREITDKNKPGTWRAYSIAIPLKREAQRRSVPFATRGVALPSPSAFTDAVLKGKNRKLRDAQVNK